MKRLLLLFSIPILALMLLPLNALAHDTPPAPAPQSQATQPVVPTNPASPIEVLEPSTTEALSIKYVTSEFDQAWKDLHAIQAEVAKNHPGYHLSDNGRIEKDLPAPVKPATKQPEPAKK